MTAPERTDEGDDAEVDATDYRLYRLTFWNVVAIVFSAVWRGAGCPGTDNRWFFLWLGVVLLVTFSWCRLIVFKYRLRRQLKEYAETKDALAAQRVKRARLAEDLALRTSANEAVWTHIEDQLHMYGVLGGLDETEAHEKARALVVDLRMALERRFMDRELDLLAEWAHTEVDRGS